MFILSKFQKYFYVFKCWNELRSNHQLLWWQRYPSRHQIDFLNLVIALLEYFLERIALLRGIGSLIQMGRATNTNLLIWVTATEPCFMKQEIKKKSICHYRNLTSMK